MRLDLVLKYLCLVKTRSVAGSLSDAGKVIHNGKPARRAARVLPEDQITVQFPAHSVTVVVLNVPEKQLSKTVAADYYRRVDTPAHLLPPSRDPLEDPVDEGSTDGDLE